MILRSPARLMLSLLIAAWGVPRISIAANTTRRAASVRRQAGNTRAATRSKVSSAAASPRARSAESRPTGMRARAEKAAFRGRLSGVPRAANTNSSGSGASSGTRANPASKGKAAKRSKRVPRRQKGQMTPTSDRISEIQQALAKDGSYSGTPNGKWDDGTVDAVKRFQEAHGLNPTGKLDAKTLQQLGLGSSTAGLAPPVPAASSLAPQKSTQTASRQ